MVSSPGLTINDLRFRYPAMAPLPERDVLQGVSVVVPSGQCAVLLGAADAGKTTLARVLAGLVPRFTGGTIEGNASFEGRDLLSEPPFALMDSVGIVFQDPDEQVITSRCDTEVAFALESLGLPRSEMERRITESLDLMGLEAMRDRGPSTLSGGEKKRLLLACLAAAAPSLWILDEIFQELDVAWRTVLLRHLAETKRTALFLDSRWSASYSRACSVVGVLKEGSWTPVDAAAGSPAVHLLSDEGLAFPDSLPDLARDIPPAVRTRATGVRFEFPQASSFRVSVDDLELGAVSVTAILGPNGSGKSTLGRLLCGLLVPVEGRIEQRDAAGWRPCSPRVLQERVGYLFQNPDYQLFLPTVAEELSYGLRAAGASGSALRRSVDEAISLFKLPHPATPPVVMSFGARRRLQAATAYLLRRDLLILDEIDSGLSYREFLDFVPLLATAGRAIVLITHDGELARRIASRILVMDQGRIAKDLVRGQFAGLDDLVGAPGTW
jgi:energy-coupling factor transport system ATP-binding protein